MEDIRPNNNMIEVIGAAVLAAVSAVITYVVSFVSLRRRFLDHIEQDKLDAISLMNLMDEIKMDIRELRKEVRRTRND